MSMMDRLRNKVAANMAQKGMEPDMADRAGRALFRRGADRVRPYMMVAPEGRTMGMKKGGEPMKESKAMAKKEIAFMKKKGAPKSMIKHEKAEYGMKKGGMAKSGGSFRRAADGIASKGKTKGKQVKMAYGGKC